MPVQRTLVVGAASLLTLATLAACAPTLAPTGPQQGRDWAFASVETGVRKLAESERSLDAFIASELDIADALDLSAEEAAAWLPKANTTTTPLAGSFDSGSDADPVLLAVGGRSSSGAVAAAYPVPQPDMETVGAAANSLSLIHEVLREALGEASLNSSTHSATQSPTDGTNPSISWAVEKGTATGAFTSSISDTNDAGDSVTVALEGQFEILACPDADGVAEGAFFTTAAVTFTPKGGTPKRTSIDIDMETITHVTDEAYAADLWARVDSAVRTGAPDGESTTRVTKADSFREDWNAYAFEFGDTGVQDRGELVADKQLDGAFSAQVDDLAEQIALLIGRAAEDYWRDGNCIDVNIEGEDVNPQPGDKQQLWVDAISAVDGEEITRGTVEIVNILGDSTVNPTGRQPLDEADYQFIAGQQIGKADPDFEVVSRRGVGRGGTGITVGSDAWTINAVFADMTYTGLSCDGFKGPWWIDVVIPAPIDETYGTELVFDDTLRSHFTAPPTGGGEWVFPDEGFWLEPDGSDWLMHNDTSPETLRMTRADPSVCAE